MKSNETINYFRFDFKMSLRLGGGKKIRDKLGSVTHQYNQIQVFNKRLSLIMPTTVFP
jgi:hypothetical protein